MIFFGKEYKSLDDLLEACGGRDGMYAVTGAMEEGLTRLIKEITAKNGKEPTPDMVDSIKALYWRGFIEGKDWQAERINKAAGNDGEGVDHE